MYCVRMSPDIFPGQITFRCTSLKGKEKIDAATLEEMFTH